MIRLTLLDLGVRPGKFELFVCVHAIWFVWVRHCRRIPVTSPFLSLTRDIAIGILSVHLSVSLLRHKSWYQETSLWALIKKCMTVRSLVLILSESVSACDRQADRRTVVTNGRTDRDAASRL